MRNLLNHCFHSNKVELLKGLRLTYVSGVWLSGSKKDAQKRRHANKEKACIDLEENF